MKQFLWVAERGSTEEQEEILEHLKEAKDDRVSYLFLESLLSNGTSASRRLAAHHLHLIENEGLRGALIAKALKSEGVAASVPAIAQALALTQEAWGEYLLKKEGIDTNECSIEPTRPFDNEAVRAWILHKFEKKNPRIPIPRADIDQIAFLKDTELQEWLFDELWEGYLWEDDSWKGESNTGIYLVRSMIVAQAHHLESPLAKKLLRKALDSDMENLRRDAASQISLLKDREVQKELVDEIIQRSKGCLSYAAIACAHLIEDHRVRKNLVREALESDEPELHRCAIRQVALLEKDELRQRLWDALRDTNLLVREEAVRQAGLLEDGAERTEFLWRAMGDKHPWIRSAAVEQIATLENDEERERLIEKALEDEKSEVRGAAVEQLEALKDSALRAELLRGALADENIYVRRVAVEQIGILEEDAERAKLLWQAVKDEKFSVYYAAIQRIEELESDAQRTELLRYVISNGGDGVRPLAVKQIATLEDDGERARLIQKALEDKKSWVRSAAVEQIATLENDEERKRLLWRAIEDEDFFVREAAVKRVWLLRHETERTELLRHALHAHTSRTVVERIGLLENDAARAELLSEAIGNGHHRVVRLAAVEQLGVLESDTQRVALLQKVINDGDEHVRSAAVTQLALLGNEAKAQLLLGTATPEQQNPREERSLPADAFLLHAAGSFSFSPEFLNVLRPYDAWARTRLHVLACGLANPAEGNLLWRLEMVKEAREAVGLLLVRYFSVEEDPSHPLHRTVRGLVDSLPPLALFYALFDTLIPMGYKIHLPSPSESQKPSFQKWQTLLDEHFSGTGGFSLAHAEHTAVAPPLASPTLAALAMLSLRKWEQEFDASLNPSFQITLPDRISYERVHLGALWYTHSRMGNYPLGSLAALKTNQTEGYAHCIYDGGGETVPFPVASTSSKPVGVPFMGRTDYLLWSLPPRRPDARDEEKSGTLPQEAQMFLLRINELARGHVLLSAAAHPEHPFYREGGEFENALCVWWNELFDTYVPQWIDKEKKEAKNSGDRRALSLLGEMEKNLGALKHASLPDGEGNIYVGERRTSYGALSRLGAETLELAARNVSSDQRAWERFTQLRKLARRLLYQHAVGKSIPSFFHPWLSTELEKNE